MKHLLLTTALVTVTAFGATAQTAPATPVAPATEQVQAQAPAANVPAFLATQFTGMTLYTLDSEAVRTLPAADAPYDRSVRWTSTDAFVAERDAWESVGSISDIVMTQDGEIRGILIDVGGFLGMFARTVMIDIDQLYFVADESTAENLSDYFVVASMSREQLEALPEWDNANLTTGYAPRNWGAATTGEAPMGDATMGDTSMGDATVTTPAPGFGNATDAGTDTAAAPAAPVTPGMTSGEVFPAAAVTPEGYVVVEATVPTADQLIGASVFDAAGDSVGNVSDLVLAPGDGVSDVIVDVGGFLGIGSKSVALPLAEAEVLWNQETDSVRVHLPMTREQLEALPEHQG